ncbi:MAG: M20 family metallopeptidase [Planctomycetaceae bacterium]|nr:M20 family metallopeptidase [Planctomycetaceae bacterium]MCB9952265.1 M20 family metallopeptidase [Planctomycetaceae bacterium]
MSASRIQSQRIRDHLAAQQDEMVALLTALARAESPSHEPHTQDDVFQLLGVAMRDRGFRIRKTKGSKTGGNLLAVPESRGKRTPIQLMLGHCDTVWPVGTTQSMPVEQRDGKLFGPGVYDMKAGLVQAVFAVGALRDLGVSVPVAPVLFVNSDEEIGSPESTPHIKRLSQIADRAFVMEPSLGPTGQLKTARKGVGRFTVRVVGKAAHAGLDPGKGVSAILELSHVVQALFALNDPERGITVNVGTIDGGMRPNVVAPEAKADADVRVLTQEDARRIEAAIHGLKPSIPGTELHIEGHIGRPPLERTPRNQRLWNAAQELADDMGIELQEGTAGGGSDGNTTSLATATLDGLGAVGDGAHAVHEHVIIEHMPERAALLAGMLALPMMRTESPEQQGIATESTT